MSKNLSDEIPDPVGEIIKSPLDETYISNRNRVVSLIVAFVVLGLTGGVIDSPFGTVKLRAEIWGLASILGLLAGVLLLLELRRVARASVRKWQRNWESEYDQFRLYVADALPGFRENLEKRVRHEKTLELEAERARVEQELQSLSDEEADEGQRVSLEERRRELDELASEPPKLTEIETSRSADSLFSRALLEFDKGPRIVEAISDSDSNETASHVISKGRIRLDILVRLERSFRELLSEYQEKPRRVYAPLRGIALATLVAWLVFFFGQLPDRPGSPSLAQVVREESRLWRMSGLLDRTEGEVYPVSFWINDDRDGISMAFPAFERGESTIDDELAGAMKEFLVPILEDLVVCSEEDRKVELEVRAFADSKLEDDMSRADGEAANIRLANARTVNFRTAILDEVIAGIDADSVFTIDAEGWAEDQHELMREAAGYVDEISNTYNEDAGRLSRRVELTVAEAGRCEPRDVVGTAVLRL